MAFGDPVAVGSQWAKRRYLDDPLLGPIVRPLLFGAASTNYTADPAETVTLTESLSVSMATAGSPSETVTLAEALSSLMATFGSPSETISLAEALGAAAGLSVSPTETVSLSEALGVVAALSAALSENPSWSESLAAGMALTAAISENVSLSEALSSSANMSVGLTDLLSWIESVIGTVPRRTVAILAAEVEEPQCQLSIEMPITIEVVMAKAFLQQRIDISAAFTAVGVAFTPSAVRFTLRRPSGVEVALDYPHADISNPSTGVYKYNVLLDEVGTWRYRWASLATDEEAAQEGTIVVPKVLERNG